MSVALRDYQREALAAEVDHRAFTPHETRLAIVLATGLGKTIVMAERAIDHLKRHDGRVLILVHTDELADQAEEKVRLQARPHGFTVGVVKAERDEVFADIIIGSVQTLDRPTRRAMVSDVGLVIVDECHHATADSYQRLLAFFGCMGPLDCPALGFTATLERGDGQSLGGVWQDVVYTRGTSWAVRKGWLVQPIGYRLEIPGLAAMPVSEAGQDQALVDGLAPELIVQEWIKRASDRPTVAFMPLVRSARALAAAFHAQGITARVVHGGMPKRERREALAAYEAGHVQVVCNAMVLTEGWDSPHTSCVIIGRATKSRPLFIQMAGRGLRPDPTFPVEDQDCVLLCVADSTTDMCTVADLSDKPLDRKTQGALTAMEDQWDIGSGMEDPEHVWLGQVDARQFDPLATRSSKVWARTKAGLIFIPVGDRRYVFISGTQIWYYRLDEHLHRAVASKRGLPPPDLELAMAEAERLAEDLGGDLGRLVADKGRAWRKGKPSEAMLGRASQLGLDAQVATIMAARAGGKAGKVSDLITKVLASRALDKFAERIKA